MSECAENCTVFNRKTKLVTSLWVALTTFIVFLIIGSPMLYWLTSSIRLGTASRSSSLPLGVAPNWWGWILHSIVAGLLGYGIGLLFMAPWKNDDRCCCPKLD